MEPSQLSRNSKSIEGNLEDAVGVLEHKKALEIGLLDRYNLGYFFMVTFMCKSSNLFIRCIRNLAEL